MKKTNAIISAVFGLSLLASSFGFVSCSNDESEDLLPIQGNATVHFNLGGNILSYQTKVPEDQKSVAELLIQSPNNVYSQNIARFASVIAFDCSDSTKVSFLTGSSNPAVSADNLTLYKSWGFEDAEEIRLSGFVSDSMDVTNAVVAHTEYSSFQIFTVAIQGTDGQYQWMSNFDVGADTENYTNLTGPHADWTTKENHKGFDVAATRLNARITDYIAAHNDSAKSKIILLTGHSRGAAIANILGALYEKNASFKSFTYAFATPETTTASDADTYTTIFNILNEDDFVPELPLKVWGFKRYGTDKKASIKNSYLKEWSIFVPFATNYVSADGQDVSYLNQVAANREDLYKLEDSSITLLGTQKPEMAQMAYNRISLNLGSAAANSRFYATLAGYGLVNKHPVSGATINPFCSVAIAEDGSSISGDFRPQYFLNCLVTFICLAGSDTAKATEFVGTLCGINGQGLSLLHKNALYTFSQKITGMAYSHSAPCYSILVENLK